MAKHHEQGPEPPKGAELLTPDDDKHVPDCSNCVRSEQVLIQLETGDGPFDMSTVTKDRLRGILSVSCHLGAFAAWMFKEGVCPFAMLNEETLDRVKLTVPVGSCRVFDKAYRPGLELGKQD